MTPSNRVPALTLALLLVAIAAFAGDVGPGDFGADAIFVHQVGAAANGDSVRASVSVSAIKADTTLAEIDGPTLQATAAMSVGSGQMQLVQAKAQLLTVVFSNAIPVGVASFYRDLDHGIDYGADFLTVRVPIKLTSNGAIVIQPGVDLGIRHYVAPVDQTSFHASFVLEARAAATIVQNWLSTGIMAQIKYDLDTGKMGGFTESGMGYLSLALDRDHNLYARVYAGAEHVDANAELGLPTVEVIGGIGINGTFGH